MKTKRPLLTIIIVFLCLCLSVLGIGFIYLSTLPPDPFQDSGYYIRWTKVYYKGGFPSSAFELEGADVFTFEILDEQQQYARDKNHVYFNGTIIPEADSATFEFLGTYYSRDKNNVYISGVILSTDSPNFEFLPSNLMRDSQHIYWSDRIISDAPSHFTVIDDTGSTIYWKDSNYIFFNGSPIESANMDTFEIIDDIYSHDDVNVFYRTDAISQAEIASFEIIESPYSRDAQKVFFMENIIPDADPQTFRILNIKFQCSADSQTAFYQGDPIPNFDPNTIPGDAIVNNCDENGIYFSP